MGRRPRRGAAEPNPPPSWPGAPATFPAFLAPFRGSDWVVYPKPPFGGPQRVLEYPGRYTQPQATSNDRLMSLAEGVVRFRRKDYAHSNRVKTMALPAEEFLRRFLLHVLPDGFVRIRHFGLLANRSRTGKLPWCRELLAVKPPELPAAPKSVAALMLRVAGVDTTRCPVCGEGRLHIVAVLRPGGLPVPVLDTS